MEIYRRWAVILVKAPAILVKLAQYAYLVQLNQGYLIMVKHVYQVVLETCFLKLTNKCKKVVMFVIFPACNVFNNKINALPVFRAFF